MTKRPKQSKRVTKRSKRANAPAQPDDETDTPTTAIIANAPQATPRSSQPETAVESQQSVEQTAPAALATPVAPSNPVTRSDAAKATIKERLKQHAIAGRPTKAQLILVFGEKDYAMTWPQCAEKFGVAPEKFQEALSEKLNG